MLAWMRLRDGLRDGGTKECIRDEWEDGCMLLYMIPSRDSTAR